MSANALPSGIALLVIASVALLFTVGVVFWHRFGPRTAPSTICSMDYPHNSLG